MRLDGCGGMTLVEVMVSLVLIALTALAVAPLFAFASRNNATGHDQGVVGAVALETMEDLFQEPWDDLIAGGSLESNVLYYSEVDTEGYEGFTVRWQIQDNSTPPFTKILSVRALAQSQGFGPRKEVTPTTLRAR